MASFVGLLLVLVVGALGSALSGYNPFVFLQTLQVGRTDPVDGGGGTDEPDGGGGPTRSSGATGLLLDGLTPTPTAPPTSTPTLTPTSTPTAVPTSTPTYTLTPLPADTSAPAIVPTEPVDLLPTSTPTPLMLAVEPADNDGTLVEKPTSRPTSTRLPATPTRTCTPTPVNTPTPVGTPPTPTPQGRLESFDVDQGWSSNNRNWGTLTISGEQARNGSAGRLAYNLPGSSTANPFVALTRSTSLSIAGSPGSVSMWVYGDDSGHYLNLRALDNTGQEYQFSFGRIHHRGWQRMTAQLDPTLPWPNQLVSDKDSERRPSFPIRITAIILDPAEDRDTNGELYFDDLGVD